MGTVSIKGAGNIAPCDCVPDRATIDRDQLDCDKQRRKYLKGTRKSALLSAKAKFWKEIVEILDDGQVSMLIAPAQEVARGGRAQGLPPPEAALKSQAEAYARLFTILENHKDVVERVTFWGLNDRRSVARNEFPLVLDINNERKPAYEAIVNASRQPPQP